MSNLSVLDEEAFLVAIVSYTNSSTVHFPLSPAYAFYLVGRSLFDGTHDSVQHVATVMNKMVAMIDTVIEVCYDMYTLYPTPRLDRVQYLPCCTQKLYYF